MRILKLADLHLTVNPSDEYRWNFFDWLETTVKEYQIDRVDILGDLTDKKDRHPELLVNRLIERLIALTELCQAGVCVLAGNHDYVEKHSPFFRFISEIPKLKFIVIPYIQDDELFLPSTKTPLEDWAGLKLSQFSCINMHQCLQGVRINDYVMNKGLQVSYFKGCKRVLSGDIHHFQKLENVEYIGAPYHIDFGDTYAGRVILRDMGGGKVKEQSIPVPSIKKLQFEIASPYTAGYFNQFQIAPGDQVKIIVRLSPSETYLWQEIKSMVKSELQAKGAILKSFEFRKEVNRVIRVRTNRRSNSATAWESAFQQFVKSENLDAQVVELGLSILEKEEEISCTGE